ncbi:hypothetical protein GCM10009550_24540 [Actinocorallia libanotica]|uniref:Pentapeptide repeat protein n=1 Tax=Actinocorallia libanotica TaxID=46162 RepID=A0ABP4BFL7_9ACTN
MLALLFVLLWPGTTWWVEHVDGVDLDGKDLEAGKDRQDLLDNARGRFTALATGILAAIAIAYTAANAKSARRTADAAIKAAASSEQTTRASIHSAEAAMRTAAATEQGLVTGRYTAAITQLGDKDSIDIRLGGIYALERIATDSQRDDPVIIEVLAAFVREHLEDDDARRPPRDNAPRLRHKANLECYRLRAALAVLGRRTHDNDIRPDLSGLDLHQLDLSRITLANTGLFSTDLRAADLGAADLRAANLNSADLSGANLSGADLSGANLVSANLSGANLVGANLNSANLSVANLNGADLVGADLSLADLSGADLDGVDMDGANLNGARWTA